MQGGGGGGGGGGGRGLGLGGHFTTKRGTNIRNTEEAV